MTSLKIKSATKSAGNTLKLDVGDYVRERGRLGLDVATPSSPNFDLVSRYRHNQRQGRIIGMTTKADRAGRRCNYAQVIWDGHASPSLHAISRLQRIEA